jgi:hypothetical protein
MLTAIGRVSVTRLLARNASTSTATKIGRFAVRGSAPLRYASAIVSRRGFLTTRMLRSPVAAKKKKTVKKPTAKKAAPKKKETTKAKAKAAPKKKKAKKELTPEEKAKLDVRKLKAKALLSEPARLPEKPWLLYVAQNLKNTKLSGEGALGQKAAELSQSFKALSSLEVQVGSGSTNP